MNKVILLGRLVKDPEMRATQTGTQVASFTLAVNRRFEKDKADFFPVVAFKNTAEFIGKYLQKGIQINIVGRLQTRNYDAKDGTKRYVTEVIAEEVYFADSKKDEKSNQAEFIEIAPNEELPF